jgi:hypothetical protein
MSSFAAPRFAVTVVITALLALLHGCDDSRDRRPGGSPDGSVGPGSDGGSGPAPGETGRMLGMTEAHNRFRAMVDTATPLPALTWDTQLAADSQAWSEQLAAMGCGLEHSTGSYGENLYWQIGGTITPESVVASWYEEIACYTFGQFMETDACDMACTDAMNSSGCGHYTQIVWRDTRRVGCGMATCSNGAEIWTCRYDPAGNYVGEPAY